MRFVDVAIMWFGVWVCIILYAWKFIICFDLLPVSFTCNITMHIDWNLQSIVYHFNTGHPFPIYNYVLNNLLVVIYSYLMTHSTQFGDIGMGRGYVTKTLENKVPGWGICQSKFDPSSLSYWSFFNQKYF